MLHFLPSPLRGLIAATLLVLNTLAWCSLLFVFAVMKLLLPFRPVRAVVDRILNALATAWVACNSGWMRLTQRAQWDVAGIDGLEYRGWYLVTATISPGWTSSCSSICSTGASRCSSSFSSSS